MKKKYRNITVNNVEYAWMATYSTLTIWLNKKVISTTNVEHMTVTPSLVKEIIEKL
jgi:hypothetical protein